MGFLGLGIGAGEVLLVLVVALMIFGPSKLPQFARNLGKAAYQFRKYSDALTKDFRAGFEDELKGSTGSKRERYQPKELSGKSNRSNPAGKAESKEQAKTRKEGEKT
jgi:sec-independent protein translocase protein TatA